MGRSDSLIAIMRKAGSTALRDMRAAAKKRIRERKAIKASRIARVLKVERPARLVPGVTSWWRLNVLGGTTRVTDYPHRQTRKGVSATINKGKRSLLRSAFVATMKSGHTGVFVRVKGTRMQGRSASREQIEEKLASRPVDALLHPGEAQAIGARGARSFLETVGRLSFDARSLMPAIRTRIE